MKNGNIIKILIYILVLMTVSFYASISSQGVSIKLSESHSISESINIFMQAFLMFCLIFNLIGTPPVLSCWLTYRRVTDKLKNEPKIKIINAIFFGVIYTLIIFFINFVLCDLSGLFNLHGEGGLGALVVIILGIPICIIFGAISGALIYNSEITK